MTDPLRRAAEMALKVLEHSLGYSKEAQARISEAKQALRLALAQPEQEDGFDVYQRGFEAGKALAQPEQEAFVLDRGCWERGCIAYDARDCDEGTTVYVAPISTSQERVDKTEKSKHEPYGYVWTSLRDGMEVRFSRMPPNKFYNPQDTKPVYTAPPKRAWVGYTNEDREKIVPMLVQSLRSHDDKTLAGLLNAILIDVEQQLKEKNNG